MNARPTLSGARWGLRPPDQRFDTAAALRTALVQRKAQAHTRLLDPTRIQAHPGTAGIVLELDGEQVIPSAFAASQISTAVGLPARALQVLSPKIGSAALNERFERTLKARSGLRSDTTLLLEDTPDGVTRLRGLQSAAYSRTWDVDVFDSIVKPILDAGYTPASACAQRPHTDRALFCSGRDMFCFLVRDTPSSDMATPHGRPLRRGIVIRNSEVGGLSLQLRAFWFDSFCTNHMVFGGSMAVDLVEPHRVGQTPPLQRLLERWHGQGGLSALNFGRPEELGAIHRAARRVVAIRGDSPRQMDEEAVNAVAALARRVRVSSLLPRTLLRAGARRARVYASARHPEATRTLEECEAVNIRGPGITLWHMACGITEVSQELSRHTDRRARIDAAIGRVLSVA